MLLKIKQYIIKNKMDVITGAIALIVAGIVVAMFVGNSGSDGKKDGLLNETYEQSVLQGNENGTSIQQVAGTQGNTEQNNEDFSSKVTEEPTTALTYEIMNTVMYTSAGLNVRNLPSEDGEIIGYLVEGKRVKITGRCNETGWYRISYENEEGYICYEYVVEECPVSAPSIVAEAAIVYDMDTGEVVYEKNADAKMYPASVTKIMTTLLACESGKLDEMIAFSSNCKAVPYDSSIYGVQVGESVTLRDSMYMLMLVSGNDVGVGIAEHLSGNEEEFAKLMTERANELGAKNTNFVNSHGYHNENHYTTARDMMIITAAALSNEDFRKVWEAEKYTVPKTNKSAGPRTILHGHKMLRTDSSHYYVYALGGKTGFHDDAGRCAVTTAKKDGRTLLCVTMKSDSANLYKDGQQLFEYIFTYK